MSKKHSFLHPTIKAAFGNIFLCPTIKTASGNILPLKGFCCSKNVERKPRPLLFLNAHGTKVKINNKDSFNILPLKGFCFAKNVGREAKAFPFFECSWDKSKNK